jgi:hypothetical protein
MKFAFFSFMLATFWINQGRFPVLEWDHFMLVVVILDMFPYTGQAQSDVADITVLLYHVFLTEVTLEEILSTAAGVHGYSIFYNIRNMNIYHTFGYGDMQNLHGYGRHHN